MMPQCDWQHGSSSKLFWSFDFLTGYGHCCSWFRLVYVRPTIQFTMDKEVEGMLPFLNVWVSHDRDSNTLVTIKGLLEAYSYRPMLALPIVPTPAVKNGISPVQEGLPRLHFSESRVGAAHLSLKQNGYPYHLICPHYPISTNMDQPEPKATVSIPFVKGVSERIKRIFAKRGIRVYFRSGRTLDSLLS